jgi:hypothetical protein
MIAGKFSQTSAQAAPERAGLARATPRPIIIAANVAAMTIDQGQPSHYKRGRRG